MTMRQNIADLIDTTVHDGEYDYLQYNAEYQAVRNEVATTLADALEASTNALIDEANDRGIAANDTREVLALVGLIAPPEPEPTQAEPTSTDPLDEVLSLVREVKDMVDRRFTTLAERIEALESLARRHSLS